MRRTVSTILKIGLGLALGIGIPVLAATPYMSLTLPTPGVTSGPTWASQINSAFLLLDAHTHAPGSGARVPSAGLNINADLSHGGFNATNVRSLRLVNNGSPLALGTDIGTVYESGGNLYYNSAAGQQVQITAGAALNAASIGAIGGDYSTSSASEFYTSATQTFSFTQAANKYASLDGGNLILRQPGVTSPQGVTLKSPTSLVGSYALTLPAALPASTKILTLDSTGNVAGSIDAAAPTFSSTLTAAGITSANGDLYSYRSGGTTGVVMLNQAGTRYLYFDGTYYQMPSAELRGLLDPTDPHAAATKNYVDTTPRAGFVVAAGVCNMGGSSCGTSWNSSYSSHPGTGHLVVRFPDSGHFSVVTATITYIGAGNYNIQTTTPACASGTCTFDVYGWLGTTAADVPFMFHVVATN